MHRLSKRTASRFVSLYTPFLPGHPRYARTPLTKPLKNAKEACRKSSEARFLTAATIHSATHQSPQKDKNIPRQAQNAQKTRARQSHSIGLQWKGHSNARPESFF